MLTPKLTYEALREIVLSFPDTVETQSWEARSFKVNKKVILFWNPKYDAPVFKVDRAERDFLIEADPDTFFTTDHHRPYPLVLARPETVDIDWVRANIERVWRAQVSRRTLKAYDARTSDNV